MSKKAIVFSTWFHLHHDPLDSCLESANRVQLLIRDYFVNEPLQLVSGGDYGFYFLMNPFAIDDSFYGNMEKLVSSIMDEGLIAMTSRITVRTNEFANDRDRIYYASASKWCARIFEEQCRIGAIGKMMGLYRGDNEVQPIADFINHKTRDELEELLSEKNKYSEFKRHSIGERMHHTVDGKRVGSIDYALYYSGWREHPVLGWIETPLVRPKMEGRDTSGHDGSVPDNLSMVQF